MTPEPPQTTEAPTPETDEQWKSVTEWLTTPSGRDEAFVPRDFARQLERDRDQLRARVAEVEWERDAKQKTIEFACCDWADDDTRVKAIAAEFGIKEFDDPDYFKGFIEIAEEMAEKIRAATSALKAAQLAIKNAPHAQTCAKLSDFRADRVTLRRCDCWKAKANAA